MGYPFSYALDVDHDSLSVGQLYTTIEVKNSGKGLGPHNVGRRRFIDWLFPSFVSQWYSVNGQYLPSKHTTVCRVVVVGGQYRLLSDVLYRSVHNVPNGKWFCLDPTARLRRRNVWRAETDEKGDTYYVSHSDTRKWPSLPQNQARVFMVREIKPNRFELELR